MFPLTRGFSFLSSCERNETKKANQGEASKMPIPLDNPLCYVGTHTLRTVPREQTDKPKFVKLFIVGKRCLLLNRYLLVCVQTQPAKPQIYYSKLFITNKRRKELSFSAFYVLIFNCFIPQQVRS